MSADFSERTKVNPGFMRLDALAAYIRGDSAYYKPFPGPEWFTPSRMAVIHAKIVKARAYMVAQVGKMSAPEAAEVERYYLGFLAVYQHGSFGGEIGPDEFRLSKHHPAPKKPRSLRDWHKLLDFLSDRVFYWAKQHRVTVGQIEAMTRVWLLIRFYNLNREKSRSIHHANDMRNSRSNTTGRKPSSRRGHRRSR